MESIRKIFEEEKQVGNYGEETFEEFYEYGIEFDKNIDRWGDGSGGIWLIEEYSKTGDDTAWNQGLNRLHKKVFYNESFSADFAGMKYELLVDETGNGLEEAEIVATYPTFEEAKHDLLVILTK